MKTNLIQTRRDVSCGLSHFHSQSCCGATVQSVLIIRSFITFRIFMGPGYDLGDESLWRRKTEIEE